MIVVSLYVSALNMCILPRVIDIHSFTGADNPSPRPTPFCFLLPADGPFRAEEIVKFRRVVGSDWLEYIYNV